MTEVASELLASPEIGRASEAAPRHAQGLFAVFAGVGGLVSGALGACALAATTVLDRIVTVPFLYESTKDVVIHASAEVLAGAAVWGACAVLVWLLGAADRRLPEAFRARARRAAIACAGMGAGIVGYLFVIQRSSRSALLPPLVWWLLLPLLGTVLAFGAYWVVRVKPKRPVRLGLAILALAVALHVFGLERYVRHYGNLQTFLLLAVVVLSALGSGLVLGVERARRAAAWPVGVALGASVLVLALAGTDPSYSTRRAVLIWGGIAKRMTLDVVWPLWDADGDGTPSRFWGLDPDDGNRAVTPRMGGRATPELPREVLATSSSVSRKNLLWVTVDTVRSDSFEQLFATNAAVRAGFTPFARFSSYVSCSSRTSQVAVQLFGDGRCDGRSVAGISGRSLLGVLRESGYRDELFAYLKIHVVFTREEYFPDDDVLIERAQERLQSDEDGQALFVHLKGGHADYAAPGNSLRERYDNQLGRSFESVAKLVQSAAPERWVVVVLGDHGEAFGEHGAFDHAATLYEEELRTAFMIRAPGFQPGPRPDRMSCDGAAWKTLYGLGLLERDPSLPAHQYAALDIAPGELGHLQRDSWRALRMGSHKAIWSPDLGIWELYDLHSDPGERRSLAASRPAELEPLRAKLEELSRVCPPHGTERAGAP